MANIILLIHYPACVFLIIVILLQAGKGADMGAIFGGGASTVFGSRGAATFLSKMTTIVAIVFMMTSVSLAYQYSGTKSVLDQGGLDQDPKTTTQPVEATGELSPKEVPTKPQEAPVSEPSSEAGSSQPEIEIKPESETPPMNSEPTGDASEHASPKSGEGE